MGESHCACTSALFTSNFETSIGSATLDPECFGGLLNSCLNDNLHILQALDSWPTYIRESCHAAKMSYEKRHHAEQVTEQAHHLHTLSRYSCEWLDSIMTLLYIVTEFYMTQNITPTKAFGMTSVSVIGFRKSESFYMHGAEDTEVMGHRIPKGTPIMLPPLGYAYQCCQL